MPSATLHKWVSRGHHFLSTCATFPTVSIKLSHYIASSIPPQQLSVVGEVLMPLMSWHQQVFLPVNYLSHPNPTRAVAGNKKIGHGQIGANWARFARLQITASESPHVLGQPGDVSQLAFLLDVTPILALNRTECTRCLHQIVALTKKGTYL